MTEVLKRREDEVKERDTSVLSHIAGQILICSCIEELEDKLKDDVFGLCFEQRQYAAAIFDDLLVKVAVPDLLIQIEIDDHASEGVRDRVQVIDEEVLRGLVESVLHEVLVAFVDQNGTHSGRSVVEHLSLGLVFDEHFLSSVGAICFEESHVDHVVPQHLVGVGVVLLVKHQSGLFGSAGWVPSGSDYVERRSKNPHVSPNLQSEGLSEELPHFSKEVIHGCVAISVKGEVAVEALEEVSLSHQIHQLLQKHRALLIGNSIEILQS